MSLTEKIADAVYTYFNGSNNAIVQYINAILKQSQSPKALFRSLTDECEFPSTPAVQKLAVELWQLSHSQAGSPGHSTAPSAAAPVRAASSKAYAPLRSAEDEYEELEAAVRARTEQSRPTDYIPEKTRELMRKEEAHKRVVHKRQLRARKHDTVESGDEEVHGAYKRERESGESEGRAARKADEEAEDEKERAYEEEARKVREFSERMIEKDREQTRRVADDGGSGGGSVAHEGLSTAQRAEQERRQEALASKEMIQQTRQQARTVYLEKRQRDRIAIEEKALEEIEQMAERANLSAAERAELARRRQKLNLAKQQAGIHNVEYDGYVMPDALVDKDGKRDMKGQWEKIKQTRYNTKDEPAVTSFSDNVDQAEWERTQKNAAQTRFGGLDKADPYAKYELILGDMEFIKQSFLSGSKSLKKRLKAKGVLEDAGATKSDEEAEAKSAFERLQAVRRSLPVYQLRDEFLRAVRENQVLIVHGETGSGKTTQLPQYLHEAGYTKKGRIACTQPRRVAASSVARRVSEEMGTRLGQEVGYSIRFEDCTSDKTVIQYMTDGMLLRAFLTDPALTQYSVIMIDEAHERTLHTDILFGLVKDIARARPDLTLLISSATMDAQKFSDFFDGALGFDIPGRRYPVDILYTKTPEADYLDAAVMTVLQLHIMQPSGDILVFLTGQEEVDTAAEVLATKARALGSKIRELVICRIYSTLPSDMQEKIFEPTPPNGRKVIFATNIAETSITIDNIVYVVDSGFVKQNSFNPRNGVETLCVVPISKASANQRAGRAGRVAAGKCFRLYTDWAYQHEMEDSTVPEIQRTNLGNVVLLLKSLGINDLIHFDFMDPPPQEMIQKALEQLYALGALNDRGQLTVLGRQMAEFPMDPVMSKVIIQSQHYKCVDAILTVCSMLQVNNNIFYRPKDRELQADNARKGFVQPQGDHLTLMEVYNQWEGAEFSTQWCFEHYVQVKSLERARLVREQLLRLLERTDIAISPDDNADPVSISKCITSGYFANAAKLAGGKEQRYTRLAERGSVYVHPSSALFQQQRPWVVYHELVLTKREYMRQLTEIRPEWLAETAPHIYKAEALREKEGGKGRRERRQEQDEQDRKRAEGEPEM